MTADSLPFSLAAAPPDRGRRWISSPLFDSIFFILSPVVVLPLTVLTMTVSPKFAILFFFLAFPHYASTFAFFFWDEYRPRHRTRWVAFFAGPLIIAAAYLACFYFAVPRIVQIILFVWNMWHVGRQSGGILSLYRHRAGVFDPAQKTATNGAILGCTFFLAFFNIETHPEFGPALAAVSPALPNIVKIALGAIAVACLARLGLALQRRIRAGQPLLLSEVGFLVTSIAIFHPFLWMKNSAIATATMLLPHYVQYLGLVWLLHRRRFKAAEGSASQQALTKVSSKTPLLLLMLFSI
ncbi:MAG TPA: hypothetical protein VF698_09315, partial [Thermoanaerobaculia bacterium]